MSDRIRCACRRCTIRGLMWPAIIITAGVLLLLNEMGGNIFSIDNTFPVMLIVIGAISLAAAASPTDGHVSGSAPPAAPDVPGAIPSAPQSQIPGQGQGQ